MEVGCDHSCVLSKLSSLPIQDNVYNWFVDYFLDHTHVTKYCSCISQPASINAGVFQGSAIGPAMYVVNSSDLKPINSSCYIDKYADDTYLLVPSGCDDLIPSELLAIEQWADSNNLKLNKSKSMEMIIYSSAKARSTGSVVPPLSDIARVDGMKILGVYIDHNLSLKCHIGNVCQTAAQCLYAIKLLKAHGLDQLSIHDVCTATLVAHLTYAIASWWGFTNVSEQHQLQSVLNRAVRWGFYNANSPTVEQICIKRSSNLFTSILANPAHVLHQYLPPVKVHKYDLRPRAHNRDLPHKTTALLCKNFLYRMLYQSLN